MDASRVMAVLTDVEEEFTGGYLKHLQDIVNAYSSVRDNPALESSSAQISEAHNRLHEFLAESISNDYP